MEAKEIKIVPPEGYEIDRENSTLDCIVFKQKPAVKLNEITISSGSKPMIKVNKCDGMTLLMTEAEGFGKKGMEVSGHMASAFLHSCEGDWITENGDMIRGYLFFKPRK
jgi:hypothetical protein